MLSYNKINKMKYNHTIWVEEIPERTKYRIITSKSGCEYIEYVDGTEGEIAD